jgi:hypothetical protein
VTTSTPVSASAAAPAPSAPASSAGASTAPQSGGTAHVGSTLTFSADGKNETVVLQQVIDPASRGSGALAPAAGSRYVAAKFSIADKGTVAIQDFINNDVTAIGSDGKTYQADPDPVSECTDFDNGMLSLNPAASTTGCITFQLPSGAKVAKVDFGTGAFTSTPGEWLVP